IFLAELAPARVSDALEFFIDLLAAVPSVIYGVLGVFIVVPLMRSYIQPALQNTLGFFPLFKGPAYGIGILTAGIGLALMVIANERTEASSNLHYQSLIELGLALFLLTFILNGIARLLIVATSQRGRRTGHT